MLSMPTFSFKTKVAFLRSCEFQGGYFLKRSLNASAVLHIMRGSPENFKT